MTPEEFKEKMASIVAGSGGDQEMAHIKMDDLMCDLLNELGYGEGVEVFQNYNKWHA